jgi:uncharacterized membrane protein YgdD (TMEM256/DUF423 family)
MAGMTVNRLLVCAGVLGFTGVGLGAFGAHGLKGALETAGQLENWKTAVFYQIAHAVALLALAGRPPSALQRVAWCWIAGTVFFSGSLYWIALGGPVRWLWPVTPLGGLLFLAGWAQVAWSGIRRNAA